MLKRVMSIVCVVGCLVPPASGQQPTRAKKTVPTGSVLLSKATVTGGKQVRLGVTEVSAAPAPAAGRLPEAKLKPTGGYRQIPVPQATRFDLGVDGWFDAEGLNITRMEDNSSLNKVRLLPGQAGSPNAPAVSYRVVDGYPDVITHINGLQVRSPNDLAAAIAAASDPRDIQVVILDGVTGQYLLGYVTCRKLP